jgi:SAM-dependent methyltransferase
MGRMSSAPEGPAGPDFSTRIVEEDARGVVNDYDSFAEAYTALNESSLINGYYCRPAILDLAGDVAGRRVLDAGCGSGPLSAALRDRGAMVTGFDSSAGMLELARRRLGPGADLRVAELGSPLPYPDAAFDDVIACLVLHYLRDWTAALAELRRVLTPGGRLIVAVDHPFAIALMQREAGHKPDYFATENRTEEWTMGGHTALMSFWTRPLHAMTDAFTAAGFRVAVISEPPPAPGARELFPEILADIPSAFLCFLFFVLEAD